MEYKKVIEGFIDYIYEKITISELDSIVRDYFGKPRDLRLSEKEEFLLAAAPVLEACEISELYYYIVTALFVTTEDIGLYKTFLRHLLADDELSIKQLYTLLINAAYFHFVGLVETDDEADDIMDDIYRKIFDHFDKNLSVPEHLSVEDRTQDLILLIGDQFLGLNHGPTKTLLDRAQILKNEMNYRLMIINTANGAGNDDYIDVFNGILLCYEQKLCDLKTIKFMDDKYDFLQFPPIMPDLDAMRALIKLVTDLKPYCIVSIGGRNMIADILSKYVPNLVISLCPSMRTLTYSNFQQVGFIPGENDLKWAKKNGLSEDHFITGRFTSNLRPRTKSYVRDDFGLKDDDYVIALIGGRLTEEIDHRLWKVLNEIMSCGAKVVIIGKCENSDLFVEDGNKDNLRNIGFQEDVLAILELCDLCINPERRGGGTSVIEALYMGVPVVSTPFGDGALGVGEDFQVPDVESMSDEIRRYMTDKVFYDEKVKKAHERAAIMLDSKSAFVEIMNKMFGSDSFR